MIKKIFFVTTALTASFIIFAQNKAIHLNYMDTSVRPQDDFYNFVNGEWMKTTQIPSDRSRWGSFDQLRDLTDSVSLSILKKSLTKPYAVGSEGQKIADLYASYLDMGTRNKQGLTPIQPYLKKVDQVKNFSDLQKLLVEFTPIGMNPFYGYYVHSSPSNSNKNVVYLSSVSLGLGRDYYQKKDEKSIQTLKNYTDYIAKLLQKLGYKNPEKTASEIIALEKNLANNLLSIEQIRNASLKNNPFALKDLHTLSKNINFSKYFSDLQVQTDTIIVPEKKYFQNIDDNLANENLDLLKNFIKCTIIREAAESLTKELDDIHFDFYGRTLRGQQEQRSLEKRGLVVINQIVGEAFGELYIEEMFPAEAKANAQELIDYLKKSFTKHIKELTWMSSETKEKALEKLNNFKVKIGYPDQWKNYSELQIVSIKNGGSFFQNNLNAEVFEYNRGFNKIGKSVDKTEWYMSPQTVNAYYNPPYNEIVFPAAILQPPFYDYKADAAVNFGGIGAVIGHEISHGFDDSGAQYDGEGNLKNWWTTEDKIKFEQVTQALADQYSSYEPLPGLFVNGKATLGENIADLGGLAIAFDALDMYLKDKGNPGKIDSFTPQQRYFISWATIWRTKIKDQALANQLKTDPHSPGYYRAIAPLENVDGFYKAFEIKETDKMYKPENMRIKIW